MAAITSTVATTDFLTLLTIQLKNQDPIDPVKQEDFISQLSQFSMLEGMEELNSTFNEILEIEEFNRGVNMVGLQAEYTDPESGERETGTVDRLLTDQGQSDLLINGQRIAIDLVSGVVDQASTDDADIEHIDEPDDAPIDETNVEQTDEADA